ncbi:hypothetical protein WLF18_02265 [Pseudomonas shirazensis]|uniref:Methyl-accepting chemotaxis protein n=1 Tax=Pseudomonas shirazensis TaxID=2745494 RepID=A0ABU8ZUA1_9PSED
MPQQITARLADLSVGGKLLLAFGLVSVLSVSAIAIAFQSSSLLQSGSRQSQAKPGNSGNQSSSFASSIDRKRLRTDRNPHPCRSAAANAQQVGLAS